MATNDEVIRVVTKLVGDDGLGRDIKEIKDGLRIQNGYVRANQIDIAQLQVHETTNRTTAVDALKIAQDLRVTSSKQGGIWGTIMSAALIAATEAFRWIGTR